MDTTTNSLNWFEIPASDLDRAKAFYEAILDLELPTHTMGDMQMAFFPYEPGSGKASGGLAQSPMHTPGQDGVMVYLNANPDMAPVLARIEEAGGQVLMPKTLINEQNGYMAFFLDSEGNRIGLHSQD